MPTRPCVFFNCFNFGDHAWALSWMRPLLSQVCIDYFYGKITVLWLGPKLIRMIRSFLLRYDTFFCPAVR